MMRVVENGVYTPEYLAERERVEALKKERGETRPFEIGKTYKMVGGGEVTCIALSEKTPGYECAQFSDAKDHWYSTGGYFHRDTGRWVQQKWHKSSGGWRYNRDGIDRGRVTGTPFDHSDPRCVIPEAA